MAIKVSYGINSVNLDTLSGKSVSTIRTELSGLLNIPTAATAHIDGDAATNDEAVYDGADVEFIKVASEKGTK